MATATIAAAFAWALGSAIAGWSLPSQAQQVVDLDTPYVQTPQNVVDAMLALAGVGRDDVLIDLGAGDGRIVITAAQRFGTRGLGVEIDPRLVELSRSNAAKAGVSALTEFRVQDLFVTDIAGASVVTMYLLPDVNVALRPRLLQMLKPGSRVVSHDWGMGDWQSDEVVEVAAPEKKTGLAKTSTLMFWLVPANVAGRWSWRQVADRNGRHEVAVVMSLAQRYQQVSGELVVGTVRYPLRVTLRGERFEASAELPFGAKTRKWTYRGMVRNARIVGEALPEGGGANGWIAVRESPPPSGSATGGVGRS